MQMRRELLKREIKILAVYMAVSIVQTFFMCRGCTGFRQHAIIYLFTLLLWVFLWRGNSLLTDYVSRKIPWIEYPLKRFVVGLATTILYTLVSVVFLMFFIETVFDFPFSGLNYEFTVGFSVFITIVISLFLHSREFLVFWRKTALDAEQFKREKLTAQYENFKNRVNPQLLFNSLKTLRELTVRDKDQAAKFIKHLSDVYRYILDTRDKELVPNQQEMNFLRSFVYLLEARYQNALSITLNFGEKSFYVTPLSVQIILETIIENSVIDVNHPLTIGVTTDSTSLRIESSNRWKTETSVRLLDDILDNIRERYRFLTDMPVSVHSRTGHFKVELPSIAIIP
jgi:sensor histidine kinase YesM